MNKNIGKNKKNLKNKRNKKNKNNLETIKHWRKSIDINNIIGEDVI